MDLEYSEKDKLFQQKVRQWLLANVPTRGKNKQRVKSDDPVRLKNAKDWQRKLYQAGYVGLGWPKTYGGQGDEDIVHQTIVNEELILANAPSLIGASGLPMLGPVSYTHLTLPTSELV